MNAYNVGPYRVARRARLAASSFAVNIIGNES